MFTNVSRDISKITTIYAYIRIVKTCSAKPKKTLKQYLHCGQPNDGDFKETCVQTRSARHMYTKSDNYNPCLWKADMANTHT
jgi:hypothetical protein